MPNKSEVFFAPFESELVASRAHGAMFGMVAGDALGAIIEFNALGTFEPVTGMRPSESHNIPIGAFTDDTSMALCIAASLIDRGMDVADHMARFARWHSDGYMSSTGECFDIGVGTRQALAGYARDGDPMQGRFLPDAGGAGVLPRVVPMAIAWPPNLELLELVTESSFTTHGAQEALEASRFLAFLIALALVEPEATPPEDLKQKILGLTVHDLGELAPVGGWSDAITRVSEGSYRGMREEEFADHGYSVTCLESALWALETTDTFEAGMLAAVNLGLDADTRAATYGALAGAIYGEATNPWRDEIISADLIREITDRLIQVRGPGSLVP